MDKQKKRDDIFYIKLILEHNLKRHVIWQNESKVWSFFTHIKKRGLQKNVNLNMVFRSRSKGNKTENVILFTKIQRLTAPGIIDQFRRKRGQKKRKDVDYKLL